MFLNYIDPATTSYLISLGIPLVAGIIVAIVLIIVFSKRRKRRARRAEAIANGTYPPPKPAPQKTADTTFVADELLKLKGLLDSGVITQEEFDKKKSQLLK